MSNLVPGKLIAFILCLLTFAAGPQVSLAKKFGFPETISRIAIFADQLPPQLNDAQVKFAATHYVGSQKLTLDLSKRIRKYNPDFVVIHYHLGIWQQQPAHQFIIDGKHWGNDWPFVTKHEDWFWHNERGERVRSRMDGKYLMNIMNPEFRRYWKKSLARQIIAGKYQGVFLDSSSPALLPWEAAHADPRLAKDAVIKRPFKELAGLTWSEAYEDFMKDLTTFLEFLGFATLPNIGALFTTWDTTDYYTTASGAFMEGAFDTTSRKDWKLAMERTLRLIRNDKIVIFQSYLKKPNDYRKRMYYLACYLLIKGKYSYLFYFVGPIFSWYPEWEVALGKYQRPVNSLKALEIKPGLYAREYEKGKVFVNIGKRTRVLSFERPVYVVIPQGGGPVTKNGHAKERLIYQKANQVKIVPWQGLIVLYKLPDKPSP